MAKLLPDPNSNGGSGDDTGGAPGWVKVFGIVFIVLVLLFVILVLNGHGPGRHIP